MLSWGRIRRALQPAVVKYWVNPRSSRVARTRVAGFELEVFPGVFHPKYFGSSSILAKFVARLPLHERTFLEMGCGSGVIALSAARAGATVTAVDINPEAVRCTLANAARNQLSVDARTGDLFSPVNGMSFDVVAWNPPFLPKDPASPPEAAFYGGRHFALIRRFAGAAREYLRPGGCIYTVVSADVELTEIEGIFRQQDFTVSRALAKRWGLRETMVILCAR
jgi:release factor glutamine methyltransferase